MSNLNYLNGNPALERGLHEPISPVEKGLELMAKHTLHDFESSYTSPKNLDNSVFPLAIYYARKERDSNNISVRMKTIRSNIVYESPFMPVFRAVTLSHKLQKAFRRNNYQCDITKEIVEED